MRVRHFVLLMITALSVLTVLPAGAQTSSGVTQVPGTTKTDANGPDFGSAIETVEHHIDPTTRRVDEKLYRLELKERGFDITMRSQSSEMLAAPTPEFESEPAFTLNTNAVRIGRIPARIQAGAWHPNNNTATRRVAPGVSERVAARNGIVVWDFILSTPPRDDITIAAAVGGSLAGPAKRDGATLRWSKGDRAVRMGEMIVVDAKGTELYRALPAATKDHVALTVPRDALDGATYPVTIDPEISPEYSAADPTYGESVNARKPAASWNGTEWLVVWTGSDTESDVVGTRISASGTVLDPAGIKISTATGQQFNADVAWNGANWLVVFDSSGAPRGVRVSAAGTVLDSVSNPPQVGPNTAGTPRVASNGIDWYVAYIDVRNGTGNVDMYGSRVSGAGVVLDPAGVALSTATGSQRNVSITSAGTDYLAVWDDTRNGNSDIYGTRISAAGIVTDGAATGIAISTAVNAQSSPSVASSGTGYAVVWQDSRGNNTEIYGARVTTGGVVTDGATTGKIVFAAALEQTLPNIAWNGTRYLVAWTDGNVAHGKRYDTALDPQDQNPITIINAFFSSLRLASQSGSTFLAVWEGFGARGGRITDAGNTQDGTVGFQISFAQANMADPDASWNGSSYLVAFETGPSPNVAASRLSPQGSLMDGAGIQVATAGSRDPAVASNGTDWLVVWETNTGDIQGRFVRADGTMGSTMTICGVSGSQLDPAVTWDGTNYIVAWEDRRTDTNGDVYATRVSPAGLILDGSSTSIPIAVASGAQANVRLASNGTRTLVVWTDARGGASWDVYATRIATSGALEEASPIIVAAQTEAQWLASVASNGTDFAVTWQDDRPASPDSADVYAARITNAGALSDATSVLVHGDTISQYGDPSIAFNGADYVIAWKDKRNSATTSTDIYASRFTVAGVVRDPSGIAVSQVAGPDNIPALTAGPYGRTGVAYQRFENQVNNAHFRFFDDPGNDAFASPRVMAASSGVLVGVTKGATLESGEGPTASNAGGKSVWFTWTASSTKLATIDTIGSDFDTLLGVYTGSSVSGLTLVQHDDDAGGSLTSKVTFTATAGTTYRIKVDGYGGASGIAVLNWLLDDVPPDTTITSGPSGSTNSTNATFTFTATETATFQCSLDGSTFATCSSPAAYTGLPPTSHTFSVRATDSAGNVDATPATRTWTVDTTPPDTTITSGPTGTVASTSASFSFNATESATFECSMDAAVFASCTSPKSYTGLPQGSHTFSVRALDAASNVDASPATRTWIIDTVGPETTITSGPAALTNSTSASFDFTSEPGATFQCSLDGSAFASCSSPKSYSSLVNGAHTFSVRATDTTGNVDSTPASRSWTVDIVAPQTTITVGPSGPYRYAMAEFAFVSESGATFQCSLDGAPYSSCSSGITYTGLSEGTHTFDVVATDLAGNTDQSAANAVWTVDTIAPNTILTAQPTAFLASTTASVSFSSNEPGTFTCRIDGNGYQACTSPRTFTGLSQGSHTIDVIARDLAGNYSSGPASVTFVVDTVAPDTTITSGPSGLVNSTSATFAFSATETSTFGCSIDGGGYVACTSPRFLSSLAEGSHTFRVRATDQAGNVDASEAAQSWTIDVTAPETSVTEAPAQLSREHNAIFRFFTEPNAALECSLDAAAYASCTSPLFYGSLSEGAHTFMVRGIDVAGNVDASAATWAWTIDAVAPETTLISGPSGAVGSTTATFEFSSSEAGTFQCRIDDASESPCTSPATFTGLSQAAHTFSVRAIDVAGNQDASAAARTWTVDGTLVDTVISGGPSGPTGSTGASFTFESTTGGATFACSLDGAPATTCTSPHTFSGLPQGSHTFSVAATDGAGNTDLSPATRTWTVDTVRPTVVITSGTTGVQRERIASFEFESNESGSTFRCSLDGVVTPCTSPYVKVVSGDGTHQFSVFVTDVAGNEGAAGESRTWTLDTTPPITTITQAPPAISSSSTARFEWTANETATFECKLDGGAWTQCTGEWTGLVDGSHLMQIHARDVVGNQSTYPTAYAWEVDTTPPDTFITVSPAEFTSATTIQLAFSSGEPELTFRCSVDSAAFAACTSPVSLTGLANGLHRFDVAAMDAAGNLDASPASRTFTVDRLAPNTSISSSPASTTPETFASFVLSSSETQTRFECSLDGSGFQTCVSPANYVRLAPGNHTFSARAIDRAGNVDGTPATFAWRIIDPDATPPTITVESPRSGLYVNDSFVTTLPAGGTTAVGTISVSFRATDAESGIASVQFFVDGVPESVYDTPQPGVYRIRLRGTIAGKHTVTFIATNGDRLSAQSFVQITTAAN